VGRLKKLSNIEVLFLVILCTVYLAVGYRMGYHDAKGKYDK
jgi:hypothetical protein